jgi:hypothetical protein
MSWKEKRNNFKQLKPKCINCKRPVGTIFSIKKNGEPNNDFRELKAICGSLSEPCNLNININAGVTYNILDHIKELEKDIEQYKNEIIEYKNQLLFGYINSERAVDNFDRIKDAINDTSFLLNINYERFFDIVDNKVTNNEISKLKEEMYLLINVIKENIKKFNSTNNIQFVRDSVDIYINQLELKLKDLLNLKYNINLVEFDEAEGVYHLIQQKNSIFDLEDNYVSPEILSFNFGEIYNRKTTKTSKSEAKPLGEDEIIQKIIEPIFNSDGSISWENGEYQKIWNNLPFEYKKALIDDKEWLVFTMNKFVENKKQNKPLDFISPVNLIIPPQIMDNGLYDFGNKTYNNIFNKFDKSYQNTLLTLYSDKNGVRNYDMMINAINNIVKQELKINNYL